MHTASDISAQSLRELWDVSNYVFDMRSFMTFEQWRTTIQNDYAMWETYHGVQPPAFADWLAQHKFPAMEADLPFPDGFERCQIIDFQFHYHRRRLLAMLERGEYHG